MRSGSLGSAPRAVVPGRQPYIQRFATRRLHGAARQLVARRLGTARFMQGRFTGASSAGAAMQTLLDEIMKSKPLEGFEQVTITRVALSRALDEARSIGRGFALRAAEEEQDRQLRERRTRWAIAPVRLWAGSISWLRRSWAVVAGLVALWFGVAYAATAYSTLGRPDRYGGVDIVSAATAAVILVVAVRLLRHKHQTDTKETSAEATPPSKPPGDTRSEARPDR